MTFLDPGSTDGSGGGFNPIAYLARQLGIFSDPSQSQQPAPRPTAGLLGDSNASYGSPPSAAYGQPPSPALFASPQAPSWNQYVGDQSSLRGIIANSLIHGLGTGIGNAVAPDSFLMPGFNAALKGGQDTEMNRLNQASFEALNPWGVNPSTGNPNSMNTGGYAPMMPGVPTAPGAPPPGMPQQGFVASPSAPPGSPWSAFTGDPNAPGASLRPAISPGVLAPPPPPPGYAAPPALFGANGGANAYGGGSAGGGQPPPMFSPQAIAQRYSVMAGAPALAGQAGQILGLFPKVQPNTYLAADGSVQPLPNSQNVIAGQAQAEAYGKGQGAYPWAGPTAGAEAWAKVGPALYED
jgi:hypothetical protein